MQLTPKEIQDFQQTVLHFYHAHGRHTLPWRTTHTTPYHILVSEIMLQQTQVDRVIPKFLAFVAKFPSMRDLARASQGQVLRLWVGLGYNRRARYLHLAAQKILNEYGGVVPQTMSELVNLPGVGPYTASAISTFAYNEPTLVIETNIRTVFIHHFFLNQKQVSDDALIPYISATLTVENPRLWYAALMDYGAYLKLHTGNATRQSKTYAKQSKFADSPRQIRGEILKVLQHHAMTQAKLVAQLQETYPDTTQDIPSIVARLIAEKLITQRKTKLSLD